MSGEKQCSEETNRKEKVMREELIFCCLLSKNRFGEPIRDALSGNKTKTNLLKKRKEKKKRCTVHNATSAILRE